MNRADTPTINYISQGLSRGTPTPPKISHIAGGQGEVSMQGDGGDERVDGGHFAALQFQLGGECTPGEHHGRFHPNTRS